MKKWLRIALTGIFYSLIVLLGMVLLAVVQLRSSGGATFDTWRLNYKANDLLKYSLSEELKKAEEKAREDANNLSATNVCLELFDNGHPKENLVDNQTKTEAEKFRRERIPPDKLPEGVSMETYCLVKGYTQLKYDTKTFEQRVKEETAKIADLKKSLDSNHEQYNELIKSQQDFLAFIEMENVWYLRPYIVVPYDLLVLLLVMFMGFLGGMVRLLREYGAADHTNPTAGDYFFIPLIGAVVSIGGFVLAKTGLLLLSSARGESSLSPFMISMVGIVSGLLAREVIDAIAIRGREMLSKKDDSTKPKG